MYKQQFNVDAYRWKFPWIPRYIPLAKYRDQLLLEIFWDVLTGLANTLNKLCYFEDLCYFEKFIWDRMSQGISDGTEQEVSQLDCTLFVSSIWLLTYWDHSSSKYCHFLLTSPYLFMLNTANQPYKSLHELTHGMWLNGFFLYQQCMPLNNFP